MSGTVALKWENVSELAKGLCLPGVRSIRLPNNSPGLLAHNRLWTWWDVRIDEPGFRCSSSERDFLIAESPEVFFVLPGEWKLDRVFVRADKIDHLWVQAQLLLTWRALAPNFFDALFPGEGPPVPQFSEP